MSQMTAVARVGARAPQRRIPATPGLRVVTGAQARRSGVGFALTCVGLLVATLLALLLLNTTMAEGSFTLHRLQATSGQLADTEHVLHEELAQQQAPASLARRAQAMGMVPAKSPAFIRLSDGAILGVAEPAKKQPGFTVVQQTPTDPASSRPDRAGQTSQTSSSRTTNQKITNQTTR